jgi:hypothetical protein
MNDVPDSTAASASTSSIAIADAHRKVGLAVLAVGLVALATWACPRHVQPGDAGEFATVMLEGGVPHPSGYPWMRVLGGPARAFAAIGMPPALAAALPCALAGAAGWTWIAAILSRFVPGVIACVAVALVATAHVVVVHTADSEVWGPLVLAVAAVLHVAWRPSPRPFVVGLVLGLAVSHHFTAIGLVPVAIAAVWPTPLRAATLVRTGARGLAGSALGLCAYATLAIGSGGPWRWGDVRSPAGLVDHVLRRDYGTFSLSLHDRDPAAADQLARVGESLARALSGGLVESPWIGAAIVLALALAAARAWPSTERRAGIGLAFALVWSAIVFPCMHDIEPGSPLAAWILERFDVLTLALCVPLLAVAGTSLAAAVQAPSIRLALAGAGVVLVGRQLAESYARGLPCDDDAIEVYARDVLRTPPPDRRALVLGSDDHRTFGVLFADAVLREGPNVLYVDASLLAHPWYRARLRERWPDLPDIDKPVALVGALWAADADVSIYLANDFSRHSAALPRVPEGVLYRVLAPSERALGPDEFAARHDAALARLVGPPAPGHSPFAVDLAASWSEPSLALVRALRRGGREDLAAAILARIATPAAGTPHDGP